MTGDVTTLPRTGRVLVVIDSLGFGGAEKSTAMLLEPLIRRGFDMEVATLHTRPGHQDVVRDLGVRLHELAGDRGRASALRQLRKLVESRQPDLVHTTLYDADILGRLAAAATRVPSVSTMATERYGEGHLAGTEISIARLRASQAIDVVTTRLTRRLHAVSAHVADAMSARLRYPRPRIDVVYRGRPDPDLEPRTDDLTGRRASLAPGADFVVLAVARHEPPKGLDRLLDAWAKVGATRPGGRLLIAGNEGSETARLRRMVDDLDLQASVALLGQRDDVAALHTIADLFVLPSRREGLPGALIEAIALRTPAVVSDPPAGARGRRRARSVARGRRRSRSDSGSTILEAVADPAAGRRRASAARVRFEQHFTLDRSADGMAAFYARAMTKERTGR